MKSRALKKYLHILRYIVPIILLAYIFSKIDFVAIKNLLTNSNKSLVLIGFLSFPARYLIFTLRWYIVLNFFHKKRFGFFKLYRIIYEGLFFGYFIPSSVGVDIYRVIKLKNTGTAEINISLILLERITGIIACGMLIITLANFIDINNNLIISYLRKFTIIFSAVLIVSLLFILIFRNNKKVAGVFNFLEKWIVKGIHSISEKIRKEIPAREGWINRILQYIINPRLLIIVLIISLINQVVGAVFSNIVFKGLGADLHFIDNLFAVPLLNIILLLPISFGGLGIREGSYILIFGLFNVGMETSLLASFILLSSTLLNVGIGGLIYIAGSRKPGNMIH